MQKVIKKEKKTTYIPKHEEVEVTYFIADDGKEFNSEIGAKTHNEVLAAKSKELAEMKPCPFCGCEDLETSEVEDRNSYWTHYTIECQECNATNGFYTDNKELGAIKAKEAWNRRFESVNNFN